MRTLGPLLGCVRFRAMADIDGDPEFRVVDRVGKGDTFGDVLGALGILQGQNQISLLIGLDQILDRAAILRILHSLIGCQVGEPDVAAAFEEQINFTLGRVELGEQRRTGVRPQRGVKRLDAKTDFAALPGQCTYGVRLRRAVRCIHRFGRIVRNVHDRYSRRPDPFEDFVHYAWNHREMGVVIIKVRQADCEARAKGLDT